MAEEEIKKLARQIAEENYNCTGNEKGINLMAMEYESVLKRVSKDYCIVPKSKVKEWEGIVEDALKSDRVITEPAWCFLWERLFGSELFEQKGE